MNKEYKLIEIDGQKLYVCEELYNKIQKCDEQDKEIERLNNIIEELEKIIIDAWKIQDAEIFMTIHDKQYYTEEDVLNRIKELKGSDKE